MEERLRRFRPREPRPDLRRRILQAAARELAVSRSVWDRVWQSRGFWAGAAAAIAASIFASGAFSPSRPAAPPAEPSSEAVETAQTIVPALGGGKALTYRIARQLSGPAAASDSTGISVKELTEDLQCRG